MTTIILGASSSIWTQLTLPNPPAGAVPFVYTDGTTIAADVTNFNYDSATAYLNLFGNSSYVAVAKLFGHQGKVVVTPVTGFTYTFPNAVAATDAAKANMVDTVIFTPAGVLAVGTVVTPQTPLDGQEINVFTTQNITALTISAYAGSGQTIKAGGPITLVANTSATWLYHAALTTWYRKL